MGHINNSWFTSNKQEWETPISLFVDLDKEFDFECDLFASDGNALCKNYFTEEQDAFRQHWYDRNFANPPYNTKIQDKFFRYAYEYSLVGITTVAVVPARTDTKRFHDYVFNKLNVEIRFIKGRLKYTLNQQENGPAPFPSCIIIWKGC